MTRALGAAGLVAAIVAAVLATAAPAAPAPPPPNDARASARLIDGLPVSLTGTTAGATVESDDPSSCANAAGSVWYTLTAGADERIAVQLDANGDLDAVVDVFQRTRSQLSSVSCDTTDDQGKAGVNFGAKKGSTYLIRVAQRANSVAGTFSLDVFVPQPAPGPPGRQLGPAGAGATLDRLQHTADAWAVTLREGVTYRFNFVSRSDACVLGALYPPGTKDFESADPVFRARCNRYSLFTPGAGEGGRYSIDVTASTSRAPQPYHVQVVRAGPDDTSPGIGIGNLARHRGSLAGSGIDVVDLYRFDVTRRSDLQLNLTTNADFDLILTNDSGHRIDCACGDSGSTSIRDRVRPGRYFVAVRAQAGTNGRYTLQRISRTITATSIGFGGKRHQQIGPGGTSTITVSVKPSVAGPVTVTIERFDPLAGWQFYRRVHAGASNGGAGLSFSPPSVGRWRARATFDGTRIASSSSSGFATLLVAGPLAQ
jgi:hypothetical protein